MIRPNTPITFVCRRFFHSRAHPKPTLEYPLPDALEKVMSHIQQRQRHVQRSEKFHQKVAQLKNKTPRVVRNLTDETIELSLNMNLDPRKPGQSLRGTLALPHGTGLAGPKVVVFCNDEATQQAARELGALHVGAGDIVEQISNSSITIDWDVTLATKEIDLRSVARLLGPRKLMPNAKVNTLVESNELLIEQLQTQLAGQQVTYRTEKEGIVHCRVGKASFGVDKLMENIGSLMEVVFENRPESYGKGKKKKKAGKQQPKYLLRASVCSTQGPGFRIDLRTVDPSSAFFLTNGDPIASAA